MKGVSFVIPNYNAERTINKTVNSILKQKSKTKFEIIIIDDKSKDNSLKVIKKFKKNSKVKIIENKKNIGLASTLNKGVKLSKYDSIAIIWCDCELISNKWLNKMAKVMDSNPKIAVVRSNLILPKKLWASYDFWNKLLTLDQYIRNLKKQRFERPTMFRKKVLEELGGYNHKTFRIAGEDTDICLKISKKGYLMPPGKTDILHEHGAYNLSFYNHLFNKALPLAEAGGVNFRINNFFLGDKIKNGVTYLIMYLLAIFPNPFKGFFTTIIILLAVIYSLRALYYIKWNFRILLLPFFKISKDLISIFGFWKGFITKKQTF